MNQHLIISPHIDDAWFDLGGSINEWRKVGDAVKVIDVFSVQSWARSTNGSPSEVTRTRKKEEWRNARRDAVELEFLDLPEGPLRGYDLQFPQPIDWSKDCEILNRIITALKAVEPFKHCATIYFPLAIGGHVDHLLVREAFTTLRSHYSGSDVDVAFYEDLPYATYFELPSDFIFRHRLESSLQQIDIDYKLTSVRNYKSQVANDLINTVKAYAHRLNSDRTPCERVWRMKRSCRDSYQIEVL